MFTPLIQDAKTAVEDAAKFAGVGVIVGVLAAIALFFFTLAAFVWAETEYGTVAAGLGLGLFFLTLAFVIVIAMRLRRRSQARQEQSLLSEQQRFASNPQWWISPVAIATGIEVLRIIGARRLIPAFTLSAVVLAALAVPRAKDKTAQSK